MTCQYETSIIYDDKIVIEILSFWVKRSTASPVQNGAQQAFSSFMKNLAWNFEFLEAVTAACIKV